MAAPPPGGAKTVTGPSLYQQLTQKMLDWAVVPAVIVSSAGVVYVLRNVIGHFVIMRFTPRRRMG